MNNLIQVFERINQIQKKLTDFVKPPAGQETLRSTPARPFQDVLNEKIKNNNISRTDEIKADTVHIGGTRVAELVRSASEETGLPQSLINAVIQTESAFNPHAVSPKGAMGLMQLMPETARLMNVEDPYSPEENIFGGSRYLKNLLTQYNGDIVKSLAAYNAGPAVVKDSIPPYAETNQYIRKVINLYLKNSGVSE